MIAGLIVLHYSVYKIRFGLRIYTFQENMYCNPAYVNINL